MVGWFQWNKKNKSSSGQGWKKQWRQFIKSLMQMAKQRQIFKKKMKIPVTILQL